MVWGGGRGEGEGEGEVRSKSSGMMLIHGFLYRIASDFSSGMVDAILSRRDIELANPASSSIDAWQRLEALVLDTHTLEGIEDKNISHITGTMVYNLVAEGRKAMQAANRVLVPGGVLGVTLGSGGEWIEIVCICNSHFLSGFLPSVIMPNDIGISMKYEV